MQPEGGTGIPPRDQKLFSKLSCILRKSNFFLEIDTHETSSGQFQREVGLRVVEIWTKLTAGALHLPGELRLLDGQCQLIQRYGIFISFLNKRLKPTESKLPRIVFESRVTF